MATFWKADKSTDYSVVGLIITLGIVYGDLGTSPLYTMKAILHTLPAHSTQFILGVLSCVFWTLTLQTTVKYVWITLRANNKGEGGVLLLFTLLGRKKRWAYVVAVLGACALLGDGVITPAITVTSAVEGLTLFEPRLNVVWIVVGIMVLLFGSQQYGTAALGKSFGPIMFFWFLMLLVLGTFQVAQFPMVLQALNPYHAVWLLSEHPHFLPLLGAVFLCTTGAEALYSDLGHCGLKNIRVSWIYVKISLVLSYFGQGAWILAHPEKWNNTVNPFFAIMPEWFLPIGVLLATLAAIIASQALISSAFTIISEAVTLKLFPKIEINYPTNVKGQVYIPLINKVLFAGCMFVIFFFKRSSAMEAAYGLSITIAMLMTSVLLVHYLKRKYNIWVAVAAGTLFFSIESLFFIANLLKFHEGGWVSLVICLGFAAVMLIWFQGNKLEEFFASYLEVDQVKSVLSDLTQDTTVPKYASNLVYLTRSGTLNRIEHQIIYSILRKQPKRADVYWLLHTHFCEDPHMLSYHVTEIIPGRVMRVDVNLGFKMPAKMNLYFQEIIADLVEQHKMDGVSRYPSLKKHGVLTDFRYVLIEPAQNFDYSFSFSKQFLLNLFFLFRQTLVNRIKANGLDPSLTMIESILMMTSSLIFESSVNTKIKQPDEPRIIQERK